MVSIATSGDLLQWHVHLHILMTDGAFSDDGTSHPLATWDGEALMPLFRERLLARLLEKHAISGERQAFELSAQVFNLFNSDNFTGYQQFIPSLPEVNPNFGKPTREDPKRRLQFGVSYRF